MSFSCTQYGLKGDTIHEWTLETTDGKEISQAAADALFGTGTPTVNSQDPKLYDPASDQSSYTFNLTLPSTGLATRYDVFTKWGTEIPDFAPKSFQPMDYSGDMSVNPNPTLEANPYFDNQYATSAKITYGPTGTAVRSKFINAHGRRRGTVGTR